METAEGFTASTRSPGDASIADGVESFCVVPFDDGGKPGHVLVAKPRGLVRVNGMPVIGGLRALGHKDELIVGSRRMFFSSESVPVVEVYEHDRQGRRPRCPVCRAAVEDGQTVVRCPGCSRVYHQIAAADDTPEKPCWTYSPSCRFCDHPTTLSGEPTWRPELEEAG